MSDYTLDAIEPGSPADRRMRELHMTLDARNVAHVVEHIALYPEIVAAVDQLRDYAGYEAREDAVGDLLFNANPHDPDYHPGCRGDTRCGECSLWHRLYEAWRGKGPPLE